MFLIIACTRPGLIRGGVRHPKSAQHFVTDFTTAQLREMLAEPELTLVLGRKLEAGDIEAIEKGTFGKPAQTGEAQPEPEQAPAAPPARKRK